jgi:predicted ATPase/serine/threonine protein kinase
MIGRTISHYRITEKLGEGGMGVVYKAEDTKLERTVALKFLSPQTLGTDEEKIRFVREAKAAARLDHSNICTVYEVDEVDGQIFMAMAFVDGENLTNRIDAGPLNLDESLNIAVQIAEGLQEAHDLGIVHRDIKSANIIISRRGTARILDFGLAKLSGKTRLTKTATIMGTVSYMSPEQARGDAVDHRTDIWSLGVVLYEMLTGTMPFDAPSDPALLHKIIYEEPEPIANLRSEILASLAQATLKMMQKEPQYRYENMEALIADLKSIQSGSSPSITVEERSTPSTAVLPFEDMSSANGIDLMECADCRHRNRAGAKFCTKCGSPLALTCANCGMNLDPDMEFCGTCGHPVQKSAESPAARDPQSYTPEHLAEKIRRAKNEISAEPRTITILLVGIESSAAATEGLELEDLHEAIQEQTQLMTDAVHRYEGTVLHFLGNGLMAAFGAPIAHEDSARRAVAAALAIRESLSAHTGARSETGEPRFRCRIGLNTGPVIIGRIGDDLSMEYTALGDTVDLGARMEQLAPPDTIYVTERTQRDAAGYFEFRDVGSLPIEGKSEPVQAYEVAHELGTRTRFDVARERGLTPLVGRETEIATLQKYFAEAQSGAGQVVSIVGEAGIGKSRLLMEFRQSLSQEPHTWLKGQCIPYGRTISYTPIIDILKDGFGIDDADGDGEIIAKMAQSTETWQPEARDLVPYLRFLLAVDPGDPQVLRMDPLGRRAGVLEAIRAYVEQTGRREPLVIAIEDLHWIDEQSEEAAESLVDVVASLPVLLVLTYRPGYTTGIAERSHVNRIGLRTLTSEDTVAVARGVLDCPDLPDDLCASITLKTGGNPFYIEEVTRHLVEAGVLERANGSYSLTRVLSAEDIPGTIQDVIRARMDRLDPEAREALQLGAVIGREFTERLLSRISDLGEHVSGELQTLQGVDLIMRKNYFPELTYMFKHALTCDVAYESLLAKRRRALHRLIGTAIEELYAERLPEHYGMLAHHWYEGQGWEKALHYLQEAASQAAERYANQEALEYYNLALEVCDRLDDVPNETRREIYSRKAEVCMITSDWTATATSYGRVVDLAREAGDLRAEGLALADMAGAQKWNHQFDVAEHTCQQALVLADKLDDDAIRAGALTILGRIEIARNGTRKGEDLLMDALRLSVATEQPLWEARARDWLSAIMCWRGRFDEAMSCLDRGALMEKPWRLTFERCTTDFDRGLFLGGCGRYTEALAALRRGIDQCRLVGEIAYQSRAWNTLGWTHNELYDWRRGAEYNEIALRLAEPLDDDELLCNARINLADCAIGAGNLARARQILETLYQNLPRLHEWMKWRYSQHCLHSLGEVLLAQGESERALTLADECLQLAERTDSRKNIVKARRLRGQVFAAAGQHAEAESEYRKALDLARSVGNPPQLWKTLDALGRTLLELGSENEARAAFEEALRVIDDVAAQLDDTDLKTTFLSAPQVESIRERTR